MIKKIRILTKKIVPFILTLVLINKDMIYDLKSRIKLNVDF